MISPPAGARIYLACGVTDIDANWVRSYIKRRQAVSRVSNRTLRRDLDALSNIFELLKAEGQIDRNPVRELDLAKLLPVRRHQVVMPTLGEIQAIIDSMHAMLARFVAVQALTGLRQTEALMLSWADVDMVRREILVRVGSQDDDTTKNRVSRIVVMFDHVYEILSGRSPSHPITRRAATAVSSSGISMPRATRPTTSVLPTSGVRSANGQASTVTFVTMISGISMPGTTCGVAAGSTAYRLRWVI